MKKVLLFAFISIQTTSSFSQITTVIYPNPTMVEFTIETSSKTVIPVQIFDLLGKEIYSENANEKLVVNTTDWQKGVYVVYVSGRSYKLVVN